MDPSAVKLIISQFQSYGPNLSKYTSLPKMTDPNFHHIRQHEVMRYVTSHGLSASPFLVVDDDESTWSCPEHADFLGPKCVRCESHYGLTMASALAAIKSDSIKHSNK